MKRFMATISSVVQAAAARGAGEVPWDCRSNSGSAVAPGVYIYRVRAGESAVAGKVVVAK